MLDRLMELGVQHLRLPRLQSLRHRRVLVLMSTIHLFKSPLDRRWLTLAVIAETCAQVSDLSHFKKVWFARIQERRL